MKSVFAKPIVTEHPLCRHFSPVQWRSACGLRGLLLTLRVSLVSTLPAEWAYELFNSVLFPLLSSPGSCSVCYSVPSLARPRMPWPFATPLTSFLPQSFALAALASLQFLRQLASVWVRTSAFVLPSTLNPSSRTHHGGHRALLPHHKLSLIFYRQCLRLPLSRQLLFMHSPYCYLTVLFLVYC